MKGTFFGYGLQNAYGRWLGSMGQHQQDVRDAYFFVTLDQAENAKAKTPGLWVIMELHKDGSGGLEARPIEPGRFTEEGLVSLGMPPSPPSTGRTTMSCTECGGHGEECSTQTMSRLKEYRCTRCGSRFAKRVDGSTP